MDTDHCPPEIQTWTQTDSTDYCPPQIQTWTQTVQTTVHHRYRHGHRRTVQTTVHHRYRRGHRQYRPLSTTDTDMDTDSTDHCPPQIQTWTQTDSTDHCPPQIQTWTQTDKQYAGSADDCPPEPDQYHPSNLDQKQPRRHFLTAERVHWPITPSPSSPVTPTTSGGTTVDRCSLSHFRQPPAGSGERAEVIFYLSADDDTPLSCWMT